MTLTNDFWFKGKISNCHNEQIFLLEIYFLLNVFKVICCRLVVCQKRLRKSIWFFRGYYVLLSNYDFLKQSTKIIILGKWLTLSLIQMKFDTSAADDFWKHCDKRRNCSWSISRFAIMYNLYSNFIAIFETIPQFWQDLFKIVCCNFFAGGTYSN